MKRVFVVFVFLAVAPALFGAAYLDVREYGARGDGVTKDTAAIQAAIDAAEKQGGGVVMVSPGKYLSGTIHLKSNVTLYLSAGATIAASTEEKDFDPYEPLPFKSVSDNETTYFRYALLTAENVHNIAILGQGTVDGNRSKRGGPKTVALKLCQHVAIRGITVQNSPNYSISFWGCDYVDVDGVTVLNSYADGIDPDASRYVRIANSFVDSWDDAICPKASPSMGMENTRGTEHLTVTNCVLRTSCSNFKFGTESSGDFRDIAFSNCTMFPRAAGRRPISGISIESVDGAKVNGVVISNVSMRDVDTPIFIRLGNRGRGLTPQVPGYLQNVSIKNVAARGSILASSVTAIPGHVVRHVTLDGINITMQGGSEEVRGLDVPEVESKYPEANMFGRLPAYAFYARHVDGLTLSDFQARWEKADVRPALVFDDVRNLDLNGFSTDTVAGAQPIVWFNDVINALVRGSRTTAAQRFLRVSGARSKGVKLIGNDFSNSAQAIEYGPAVARSVVQAVSNAMATPPPGRIGMPAGAKR